MAIANYGSILKADGEFLAFAEDIAYKVNLTTDEFSGETEYSIEKSVKDTLDELDLANSTVMTDFDDRLTTMETALDNVVIDSDENTTGVSVLALSNKVTLVENKINSMFVVLTLEEYAALGDNEQQGVLYLIKKLVTE